MKTKYFLFFVFFFFLKREINLKVLNFFILKMVFRNISKKIRYFNTRFVSYNINIQPDIIQN
jgi:hypothetical protein